MQSNRLKIVLVFNGKNPNCARRVECLRANDYRLRASPIQNRMKILTKSGCSINIIIIGIYANICVHARGSKV